MTDRKLPKGWDESKIRKVLEHYDAQTDEEALAEDEAAREDNAVTFVAVPRDLVDEVRELILRKTGTDG